MNKKQLYRLLFGLLCFVWIGFKLVELLDPAETISRNKKLAIYIGMFAYIIIGGDMLHQWWKHRRDKDQLQ